MKQAVYILLISAFLTLIGAFVTSGAEYVLPNPVTVSRVVDRVEIESVTPPQYGSASGAWRAVIKYQSTTNVSTNGIEVLGNSDFTLVIPATRAEILAVTGAQDYNAIPIGVVSNAVEGIMVNKAMAVLQQL